jgi:amino acid adenylation domain-containing protein
MSVHDTEAMLLSMWRELLETEEVEKGDDFFELGGSSAQAVELALRLRGYFKVDVPLDIVFERRTPAAQLELVGRRTSGAERPLTQAQNRVLVAQSLHPYSPLYSVPVLYEFTGDVDPDRLQDCLQRLVERHDALRTRFTPEGLPVVDTTAVLPVRVVEAVDEATSTLVNDELREPVRLDAAPAARALIVRSADDRWLLLLTVHHAVADGHSLDLLDRELQQLYGCSSVSSLPKKGITHVPHRDVSIIYWNRQLDGAIGKPFLPNDRPRSEIIGVAGGVSGLQLDAASGTAVDEMSQALGASAFVVMLAAYVAFLHRYAGDDVVVGIPAACRTPADETTVGMFVNILPIRVQINRVMTFVQLVSSVRRVVADALAHQQVGFQHIARDWAVHAGVRHHPLVQATFSYTDESAWRWAPEGAEAVRRILPNGAAKYELLWTLTRQSDGTSSEVEYHADLFSPERGECFHTQIRETLTAVLAAPYKPLESVLPGAESHPSPVGGKGGGVHDLVVATAAGRPQAVALRDGDAELTYGGLAAASGHLARGLVDSGVQPGDLVGIAAGRGAAAVVAELAVLRAGAAYVPVDLNQPPARSRAVLANAGVSLVLCEVRGKEHAPPGVRVRLLADPADVAARGPFDGELPRVTPWHVAYVIHTSGSTGVPKGVVVPHDAIARLVPRSNYVRIRPDDVVVHLSNLAFDAATFEVWGALTAGATLVIVPHDVVLSARRFHGFLRSCGATVAFVTTALFNTLVEHVPDIFAVMRVLLFGGEQHAVEPLRQVLDAGPPTDFMHVYGPTENTTFSTYHRVTAAEVADGQVPIGKAIEGTLLRVVDDGLAPVAAGGTGELSVGGRGLAYGYLGDPVRTAATFIADPFSEAPGQRMYRTGDLVRVEPDGGVVFLGRRDDQVKIRGFRIEIGEVERKLLQCPGVIDGVVLVRDSDTGRELIGVVVGPASVGEIQAHLSEVLPEYMVPTRWASVGSLPMTPNGKVDREALLAATVPTAATAGAGGPSFCAGGDTVSVALGAIWKEVLEVDEVSDESHFFSQGGESIKVLRLVGAVHQRFGVELDVVSVFRDPVFASLVEIIEAKGGRAGGLRVTAIDQPRQFPELLAKQVSVRPDAPALVEDSGTYSYRRLHDLVGGQAAVLQELGVAAGDRVALELPRSREYLVALLAVWAVGAVAVPLDPDAPAERRVDEIRTAGCRAALTSVDSDGVATNAAAGIAHGERWSLPAPPGDQPAYVLFTSGSSGQPKGVQVGHRSLAGLVTDLVNRLPAGPGHLVLSLTTPVFDVSLVEMLLPLVAGGAVAMAPTRAHLDLEGLAAWLERRPVSLAQATPTWWRLALPFVGPALRNAVLITAGEALSADLARRLRECSKEVWNLYGPTEATVYTTAWRVGGDVMDPLPIGLPVAGAAVRVADPDGNTVPVGTAGELLIGGPCLAHGYIGDPELTAERFRARSGGTIEYRTGDLCRVGSSGALEYLGRLDNQVKILGRRVELEELEAVAQQHPAVVSAVALARDRSHETVLDLVVRVAPGEPTTRRDLRAVLSRRLPEHMLPRHVYVADAIPLTASGKVDRREVARLLARGTDLFRRLTR